MPLIHEYKASKRRATMEDLKIGKELNIKEETEQVKETIVEDKKEKIMKCEETTLSPEQTKSIEDWLNEGGEAVAQEVTEQLALINQDLFQRLTKSEVLHRRWLDGKNGSNFQGMIDHFNTFCFWVQERIVKQIDLEERRKILIFFIEVGHRSVKCGNFDVAMAIFTAFNSAAVSRLKDTFMDLPKKSSKKWNELIELFSWERSYFNYREKMRQTSAPIVPCLGIITKDLFVIEESNPTILNSTITGEELVNFS